MVKQLTIDSMNHAITRQMMLWMHTNVHLTLIRPTCISKRVYSFYAIMANPQACLTREGLPFHKMYILSNIKLLG